MSDRPKRIQLSRAKGWRMPENTVKVDRTTKWGNPWTVASYEAAGWKVADRDAVLRTCVQAFRAWLERVPHWGHGQPLPTPPDLSPLRGKNLACWCALDAPCHADVLLELANAPDPSNV